MSDEIIKSYLKIKKLMNSENARESRGEKHSPLAQFEVKNR